VWRGWWCILRRMGSRCRYNRQKKLFEEAPSPIV
jgi:hypothetical protein